jgi:hypothetical protein
MRPKLAYLDEIHFKRGDREKIRFDWRFNKDMPLAWQTNCSAKKVISVQCTKGGEKDPPILATFIPSKKKGTASDIGYYFKGTTLYGRYCNFMPCNRGKKNYHV